MLKLFTATAIVSVLAIPAFAFGGPPPDPEYGGKIDDKKNRYIGFDIAGGDQRTLKRMFIRNVPFSDCDDPADNGKDGGSFQGKFKVDQNGRFEGTKEEEFDIRGGPFGLKYTLKGKLEGKRAEGTLKVKVLGSNCRSGVVEWVAKKPAPPVPQS